MPFKNKGYLDTQTMKDAIAGSLSRQLGAILTEEERAVTKLVYDGKTIAVYGPESAQKKAEELFSKQRPH